MMRADWRKGSIFPSSSLGFLKGEGSVSAPLQFSKSSGSALKVCVGGVNLKCQCSLRELFCFNQERKKERIWGYSLKVALKEIIPELK